MPAQPVTSVTAEQLLSRRFGVAATSGCRTLGDVAHCRYSLLATEDLGRTWTDITPPAYPRPRIPPIDHVFFLDAEHGWVTAGDCALGTSLLFRTSDGGRTWQHSPIEPFTCNAGAGILPWFIDPNHGWLVHLEPTGPGASIRLTTDGGRTWSRELGDFVWISGVTFVDPLHGWLSGVEPNGPRALFRTEDGGRTWEPVPVPLPPCCQAATAVFDAPTFFDASHGMVPIELHRDGRRVIAFDTTDDGGRTWTPSAVLHRAGNGGTSGMFSTAQVSIPSPETWWVDAGRSDVLYRTGDAGRSWSALRAPTPGQPTNLQAIDPGRAWLIARDHGTSTLFVTRDGGNSWRPSRPISLRRRPAFSSDLRPAVRLPGSPTALAAGPGGVVYASYPAHVKAGLQVVVRYDPANGSVALSRRLAFGGQGGVDRLAYADGSVWVAGGVFYAKAGRSLYRLDASTLDVRQLLRMRGPVVAVVAVPAGVWVAAGRILELLDPASGAMLRSLSFRGRIHLLVADPAGERLYLTTDEPVRHDETPIFELDARTGATIARSWQGYADLRGPSGLAATSDGVWVTTPTGMMAALTFLRADLHQAVVFEPEGPNSESAYVVADTLLVTNLDGGYTCADPSDGRVLGYVGIKGSPTGGSNVVETDAGIYVGGWRSLLKLRPSLQCLGKPESVP